MNVHQVPRSSRVFRVEGGGYRSEVEVRCPGPNLRMHAIRTFKDDPYVHAFALLIACTHVPGTSERIYFSSDVDELMAMPFGGSTTVMCHILNDLVAQHDAWDALPN